MIVDWQPYKPGDAVDASPSRRYWVHLRAHHGGQDPPYGYDISAHVAIATREYAGALTWVWRTDDNVDDDVTHYAPMQWPRAPGAAT